VAFEFPVFIQKLKQHRMEKGSKVAPFTWKYEKSKGYNSSKQPNDYYQSCNLHENKQTAGRN
jgi:hypothetical protein